MCPRIEEHRQVIHNEREEPEEVGTEADRRVNAVVGVCRISGLYFQLIFNPNTMLKKRVSQAF